MTLVHRAAHHRKRTRDGLAAVELAVVLPMLLIFIVGVWELGRMIEVQQLLCNAAREGARQASTGSKDVAGVKDVVVRYLQQNGISNVYSSDVLVLNLTDPGRSNPMTANQLDQWQVKVTLPFDRVRWIFLNQVTKKTSLIGSAHWLSTRDIPLVVNSDIPLQ
ncbi:MAG: pilus assembly protein [Gemmataceae bacterium]|nr:pilus assembly protein [Gemmataceae bacterium]